MSGWFGSGGFGFCEKGFHEFDGVDEFDVFDEDRIIILAEGTGASSRDLSSRLRRQRSSTMSYEGKNVSS
jgi:hypothetical protein